MTEETLYLLQFEPITGFDAPWSFEGCLMTDRQVSDTIEEYRGMYELAHVWAIREGEPLLDVAGCYRPLGPAPATPEQMADFWNKQFKEDQMGAAQ